MYHPFLEGNRIYLRGIEKKDLQGNFFQWANDKEVTRFLFMGVFPNNQENLEEWFEHMRKSDTNVVLMIVNKSDDKVIGFTGLFEMRWIHRTAEFRLFIGEKDYWGKGYAQEATKLVLRYGFELLNFNKIWSGINTANKESVNFCLRCGFVEEGILRAETYRNSRYYDVVRISILRKEYEDKCKKAWDEEISNIFEKRCYIKQQL